MYNSNWYFSLCSYSCWFWYRSCWFCHKCIHACRYQLHLQSIRLIDHGQNNPLSIVWQLLMWNGSQRTNIVLNVHLCHFAFSKFVSSLSLTCRLPRITWKLIFDHIKTILLKKVLLQNFSFTLMRSNLVSQEAFCQENCSTSLTTTLQLRCFVVLQWMEI